MEPTIVAREDELAEALAFIASARDSYVALVFEGDPGIGKTTLWRRVVEQAKDEGFRVLTTRASSAETRLTFVALGDLLDDVEAAVFDELPKPQRRALDAALLRADVKGAPRDQRSVATAVLSVFRALARERPVLVAIDDVQWLDRASQNVLAFVFRRLGGARAGILLTQRTGNGHPESVLPRENLRRIRVGTLSLAAIHDILATRLGHTFPRPTLVRIEQTSGGNPFFALELGRALVESETPVSGAGPLPVPETLQELLARRVQRLPQSSRDALVLAATLAQPSVDVLDRDAVLAAEETGVVSVDNRGAVEFTHPLLASAVYGSASARRRREAHREAAGLVEDSEERARHLALAAEGPDKDVAAALVDAARTARTRGAVDTAIELFELAYRSTPTSCEDELRARQFELAQALGNAGDPRRASQLLRDLIADSRDAPLRARARVLLAFLLEWEAADAVELCEHALADAAEDAELRAEIHSAASRICDQETARKLAHAHAALELVEGRNVNPWVHAYALLAVAEADFHAGCGIRRDLIERASAIESSAADEPPIVAMLHRHSDLQFSERLLAILQLHADEFEAARALFQREYRAALDEGDESQLARTLLRFVMIELRSGECIAAEAHLRELDAVVDRTGQSGIDCMALIMRAHLSALRGDVEAGRSTGELALATGIAGRDDWQVAWAAAALGFVALSAGDHANARSRLEQAAEINERVGMKEPRLIRHCADHIETLIALGDLDTAEAALLEFERQAETTQGPWSLALSRRCRALLSAAKGEVDDAERALEEALDHHEHLPIPFELGRTLLCQGQVLRRKRQKAAARVALQRALDIFESIGAPLWAEKARAEFERTHVREAPDELTPTEERVAVLAASGLTNKKIAEQLFVSPKTVEANLARVYRKLDIGSRAELGARMAEREQTIS